MKIQLKNIACLSLLYFYSPLYANIENTNLKLSQLIKEAKSHDPNFQKIIADRLQSRYLVDLNLPSQKALVSVSTEYGISSAGNTTILSASIGKSIIKTGTNLSISRDHTDRPDREERVTKLRLEQSIYGNAFGSRTRLKESSINQEINILELQVAEAFEDYMGEIIDDYLDLNLAYLELQTAKKLELESKSLLQRVEARKNRNIATSTDVNRVKLQTLIRSEQVLNAQIAWESKSKEILQMIGSDKKNSIVTPATIINYRENIKQLKNDFDILFSKSRSKLITEKAEQVAQNNIRFQKQSGGPQASLIGGYNIDDSNRFSSRVNRKETVVGVQLSLPFGDSVAKANVAKASQAALLAQIDRKKALLNFEQTYYVLRNQLDRQVQKLEISEGKKLVAQKIVLDEERRYHNGRIELERLIESRNNLAQYSFDFLSDLTQLNKLFVKWLNTIDQLVIKDEVSAEIR